MAPDIQLRGRHVLLSQSMHHEQNPPWATTPSPLSQGTLPSPISQRFRLDRRAQTDVSGEDGDTPDIQVEVQGPTIRGVKAALGGWLVAWDG